LFDYEALSKIIKELIVMGNVFFIVNTEDWVIEVIPTEYVAFRMDENNEWKIVILTKDGWVEPSEKVYHIKVTPLVGIPWGIPPLLAVMPYVELKEKMYEVIGAVATLAKNPTFKISVKNISILNQIKKYLEEWRTGGINFIALPEGMGNIEPVQPPSISIERFLEMIDAEVFANIKKPDPEQMKSVARSNATTVFMLISAFAKRLVTVLEAKVTEVLKDLGLDAEMTHGLWPHEVPTLDLQSLVMLVDMGVIGPDEIRKMSPEERMRKLRELRAELIKLRTQAYLGTLTNVGRIRQVRKDIARILTIMREEELKSTQGKKGSKS